MKFMCRFLSVFLIVLAFTLPAMAAPILIKDVQVEGSKRVEQTTVLSYLGVEPGQSVERRTLDRGMKALFATGLFADVSMRQEGTTLIVSVIENPVVNEIVFEGNDALDDDELMLEIAMRPRQIFTRTKVQSDVTRLYQIYRRNGRFSADIEPKVIKLDQNRVNLVFEIDEGDITKVKTIRFIGNNAFHDAELRTAISTQEAAWYRFISNSDRYDPDRLSYDQELLRQFYLSHGYADFNLLSAVAELSKDKEWFHVTFTVDEGQRYKISSVDLDSQIDDLDTSALTETVGVVSGDWYSSDQVQKTVNDLTDKLGDLQYAFVNVYPKVDRNQDVATLDLTFKIDEAPRAFIEAINIHGNVRTLDKVIRREMLLVEGDPFNKSKLSRSEQNIRDLDFFETVNFNVRQGASPDKTIVDIDVTEKSTGEISLGAGFSTTDGVIGDVGVTERNLLGKGQSMRVSALLSADKNRFDVSFVEPYFMNRDVSAGIALFNRETSDIESRRYDEQNTGGSLFMNYPLSDNWRQTLKYRLDRSRISDIPDTATRFLLSQEGERTTSAISQRVVFDDRNSKLFPTEGKTFWFETELAGLGFDSKHVSAVTGVSYYYPVMEDVTFNLLTETGAIQGYGDEDVEASERFSLGGSTSFRGFERYGVGPRDLIGSDDLGGNLFYRGTAQVDFPLGLSEEAGVNGFVFSDFGSLWDADEDYSDIANEHALRMSAGVGVAWRSPFGPISVYYANPFMDEDYDQLKEFEVSFGTRF
ncbi:MAG: outer membrane protein assembly factor BamA [Alphaproteobacteria bacterium]|nr:outer membrane protein assembly factor BamA [Alphaproteobacteria bacterium]HCQ70873.1 outer membrane protein assembly factor BamA [Rhodospirillaceae bacterium]